MWQIMTPSADTGTYYGTLAYEEDLRIWELHSTNYDDALWMTQRWRLPLYQSNGPAGDWVLINNPDAHAVYPEEYPREGI